MKLLINHVHNNMAEYLCESSSQKSRFSCPYCVSLFHASQYGHKNCIIALLDNNINEKDNYGFTALHFASDYDECIKILLDNGANVNEKNSCGQTALHIASNNGKQQSVITLLKYGAQINEKDDFGETPAHYAGRYGHNKCLITLLENGADFNIKNDREEILIETANNKSKDIIKKWIESNIDLIKEPC